MDRNLSYSRYFAEKSQSLFTPSNGDCLEVQDSALQESMFTEIDEVSGWSAEGYPVLLNGSLIAEDQAQLDDVSIASQEISEETDLMQACSGTEQDESTSASAAVENAVSDEGFITTDGLFVSNELLLHLNLQSVNTNEEHALESSFEPTLEVISDRSPSEELDGLGDAIQMLNSDGSIVAVDRSLVNNLTLSEDEVDLEALFEVVSAFKCKFCGLLCEERDSVTEHLKNEHFPNVGEVENCSSPISNAEECDKSNPGIKTVEMKSILNVNCNKETKQIVYLCTQCNMGYASKHSLQEHVLMHHKRISLPNAATSKQDTGMEQRQEEPKQKAANKALSHLMAQQQKASRKIKCSFKGCELKFSRDDLIMRHEDCHDNGNNKGFKCTECQEKFTAWRLCSSHLWKCHKIDMGLLSCSMCKFKCFGFGRLKVHMAIHDDDHPFICHECGKGFKQYSQLKNHEVIHKNPEIDQIPDWASQKQCDTCKKYFANSKTLKKHVQIVHNKFKPFMCNICGHKTARKSMLDLHRRQHTGEKPHKCPICVYKTGDPNCLRRHIMRHEGITQYTCPHCDYQAIQSTSYKNHIVSKHPGQGGTFYCSVCSYHTVSETSYHAHKLEHRTNKILNVDADEGLLNNKYAVISKRSCALDQSYEVEEGTFSSADITDETETIPSELKLQVPL